MPLLPNVPVFKHRENMCI